ncbi:MAG: zinc-finger domain-containing protein [Alphaproteobacteria bacterium]|jgi:uncharacterized Zn-finger protein
MARKAAAKPSAPAQPATSVLGPAPEVIAVHSHRIACDGGGGALGHPRVWLEMGDGAYVECPYCDRRFVPATEAGHGQTAPGVYEGSGGH